ncbi:MAG: hypothetical protein Q9197_000835 [Variospora fuerteventurae]
MASSSPTTAADVCPRGNGDSTSSTAPPRPTQALTATHSTSASVTISESATNKKRRNHRGGRKKKSRRQSFAVPNEEDESADPARSNRDPTEPTSSSARPPIYRFSQSGGRNLSSTSLDSQALLDHRDHPPMRTRRESRLGPAAYTNRASQASHDLNPPYRPSYTPKYTSSSGHHDRRRSNRAHASSGDSEGEDAVNNDRTPLLSSSNNDRSNSRHAPGYGMFNGQASRHGRASQTRRSSAATSTSSKRRRGIPSRQDSVSAIPQGHDVNNPPSVPGSPKLGPDMGYEDAMITDVLHAHAQRDKHLTAEHQSHDQLIDIDGDDVPQNQSSTPSTPRREALDHRRHTIALGPEDDVCYPLEGMSEMAEDDYPSRDPSAANQGPRRRRFRKWPDLSVLEEWSWEEKEERSEGIRAKKISEPVLIGGRLRPQKYGWHRAEEDAPYRFTYFNEELPSTIHSQTISELLQPGQSFQDLFVPEPPELSSDESSADEEVASGQAPSDRQTVSPSNQSRAGTRHASLNGDQREGRFQHSDRSGEATPQHPGGSEAKEKAKRYGARPTFWLDVLSPTDAEMRVISKTFGIHPLTAEDIMMQEAREKVELFRHYYFFNYRTFEQDTSSENYLEPVNMYVVVFREAVISFHFSMTPHPANVRRRIRQLKDYLILSSDWISYAIIDDITDVFAPLIQGIEEEVENIDDQILQLHLPSKTDSGLDKKDIDEKATDGGEASGGESGGDMLRRVGEGRKKVMGLYRLLGNKADVIKGFAKRCNEHWEIAPRSEIGLYLGDIQDHILTMTSNLSHYETLLSRAHSNYLAQINIRMNERQEQTADVLGKLTVLGTIVLPMNIITGMWGMNVKVPGEDVDNLYWFWSITAGLLLFGTSCFFIAKRVYGIV